VLGVFERVLWNAWSQTLLDVVQPRGTERAVEVLALVADMTGHTVRYGDVVWTISCTVNA